MRVKAIPYYQRATKSQLESPVLLDLLGDCYLAAELWDRARGVFVHILDHPERPGVAWKLERLGMPGDKKTIYPSSGELKVPLIIRQVKRYLPILSWVRFDANYLRTIRKAKCNR